MTKEVIGSEDLLVLARRGELSEAEQRRLQLYLQSSPASRALYQIGIHYDHASSDEPGDTDLIERAVARACQRRSLARKDRPVRHRVLLISAIALMSSASLAAATLATSRLFGRGASSAAVSAQTVPGQPLPASRAERIGAGTSQETGLGPQDPIAAAPTSPPPTTPSDATASAHESAHAEDRATRDRPWHKPNGTAPGPASAGADRADPSASQLFSEANGLRKAGQVDGAERAYRQLQRVHPSSPEAAVSHVLLGRILLHQGLARAAAAEFDRYLANGNASDLAEEALQGKAAALKALGDRAGERAVWEALLARYPSSLYARLARERLKWLRGAADGTTLDNAHDLDKASGPPDGPARPGSVP